MSRNLVAANWKMNLSLQEADALVDGLVQAQGETETPVILGVPHPFLEHIGQLISDVEGFHLAAQNVHHQEKGAYTGEVSAKMLHSVGVEYVIIGHSERRAQFAESDALLSDKVNIALAHGLKPIFCLGESAAQREAGETEAVVLAQLKNALFALSESDFAQLVIAYEPIWAIGTGKTATPEDANSVHAVLRKAIGEQYGAHIAEHTTILYGGSVKAANAAALFAQPDIDGGLVGGASLKVEDFSAIVEAC